MNIICLDCSSILFDKTISGITKSNVKKYAKKVTHCPQCEKATTKIKGHVNKEKGTVGIVSITNNKIEKLEPSFIAKKVENLSVEDRLYLERLFAKPKITFDESYKPVLIRRLVKDPPSVKH